MVYSLFFDRLSGGDIIMKTEHDWSRVDALTDAQIRGAALADPDAQPLTPERLAGMKQTPRVRIIRRALGLTQEQFAARFHIPLGTLRDWEQGAAQPDQTARAYLRAIAGDAGAVQRALEAVPFVAFMEGLSADGLDLSPDRDIGRDVTL